MRQGRLGRGKLGRATCKLLSQPLISISSHKVESRDVGVEEMVKVVTHATHRALEKLHPSRDCTNWCLQLAIYKFSTLRAGIARYDSPGVAPSVEMALGQLFNIPKGPNLHITNDIDLSISNAEASGPRNRDRAPCWYGQCCNVVQNRFKGSC
jgi:hypothetical protein